jgi:hypothetical protein
MSLTELVEAVEVIVDTEGHKKAVLDWSVWEEIVTLLAKLEAWEAELAGWEALSDEALLNFETELEAGGAG